MASVAAPPTALRARLRVACHEGPRQRAEATPGRTGHSGVILQRLARVCDAKSRKAAPEWGVPWATMAI